MNIKRAKEEIKDTIKAYLLRMRMGSMSYHPSGRGRCCLSVPLEWERPR